ncbi:MAG TPA: hypothetical protein VGR51_00720 [Thermoplasmata archaeon]|jgi:hypothetical protein|nr:hypothetical protein [Thermoplasmata archaeon]
MALPVLTAVGAALIVFFLALGALYLVDPSISEKVWLGILFVLIGVMILFALLGFWDFGVVMIGAIGALVGRVLLDRMGVAQ